MSGVTEVRLYRNTVDEVPLEYTNVTAALLNSSTKNHATGVKRYLDGVTTVSGLASGTTYYFWVELVDARGNTAGPQPAGSNNTATLTKNVPALSSPTSDGYVVMWSSQWRVSQEGWRVFDRINNADIGGWAAERNAPLPHWVAIELPELKRVVSFRIWTVDVWENFRIRTFEIQGRNGDEDPWDVLGGYNNISYVTITPSEKESHPLFQEDITARDSGNAYMFEANLTSTGMYKNYRIITNTLDTGGLTITMGEWVLLG
jgi:hypothetical protein